MIDFKSASVFKMKACAPAEVDALIRPLLVPDEEVVSTFRGARDFVVFTDKRLIAVDVQGISGKKKDFTSLPYSKIQAFSVETAGTFDLDAELEMWFSGLGKVHIEFKGATDIVQIGQLIGAKVLQ